MAKKKKKTAKGKKTLSPAQEGHQLTFVLLGHLKRARLHFLVIGQLLAQVRDRKLYVDLKHPDMEDYAEKRLKLGRSSLYQYINVYDWVKASHPEWLEDKVKGFIPDLSDISDLMWIEEQLKSAKLSAKDRAELEALRKKGLNGELRARDLVEWRGKKNEIDTIGAYYGKLRSFRTRCARITGMPAEVIAYLDAAIEILKNRQAVAKYGFDASKKA